MSAGRQSGLVFVLHRHARVRPIFASKRVIANTTGILYAVGGALGLATLALLPPTTSAHTAELTAIAVGAVLLGLLSIVLGRYWYPNWLVHLQVLGGIAFISVAVLISGGGHLGLVLGFLYTFAAIDCFFFFAWPIALAYLVASQIAGFVVARAVGLTLVDVVLPQGNEVAVALTVGWLAYAAAQAEVDPLTGLLNRRGFDRRARRLMAAARRGNADLAMLLLDLDDFKRINDEGGHAAGDKALREVARAWGGVLQELGVQHTLARIGGDEFAVLLPGEAAARSLEVAGALRGASARAMSAGAARFDTGDSLSKLIGRADVALYEAKSCGGGRTVGYAGKDAGIADELCAALAAGQFEVYFQPIVSLSADSSGPGTSGPDGGEPDVNGSEALLRWNHPTRGLVPPDEFIPAAEISGAIVALGAWVLRQACRHTAELIAATGRPHRISVNAAGRELRQPDYAEKVAATLAVTGLPARSLVIEVTETTFDADHPEVIAELWRLRDLGVQIAIDDFGTGYSSLSRLDRLPADVIKIDRSFVAAIPEDGGELPILRAIVALADALDVRLVAEGVETARHAEILRELGCGYAQGYYFGRPAPARPASLVWPAAA